MKPQRQLNVKVLLILLAGTAVTVLGVFLLHGVQVRRTASYLLKQAEREENEGNLDKAMTSLELYVGFRRDDNDGLARLGHVLDKRAKRRDQKLRAAAMFETVARKESSRTAELRRAAELYSEVGLFKVAKPLWQSFLEKNPNDGEAEGMLARGDEEIAQYGDAETKLASAIRHSPKVIDLYLQYAALLKNRRNLTESAAAVLDHMVAANRDIARAYTERARFRLSAKLPNAESDLARARELQPDSIDLALLSAQVALRDGKNSQAIDELTLALKAHPKETLLYLTLARSQLADGKADAAIATFRQGLDALPDSQELRWNMADTLLQEDKVQEAQALIAAMREKTPNSPPLDYLEARAYLGRRQWADAIRKLDAVSAELKPWPDMARMAQYFAGTAYERLSSLDLALAAYNRASAMAPDWVPGKLRVAATLTSLGRFDEAIREYRTLPITTAGVRPTLVRIRMAQNARLPEDQRSWGDIEALIDEAERAAPRSLDVLSLRIEYLSARGRTAEARALVEKARADFPEEVAPSLSLANLLQAEGKMKEALTILDEAQAKFGDTVPIRLARVRYWTAAGGQQAPSALAALRTDLDKFPQAEQAALLNGLALASSRLGNTSESGQLLNESVKLDPTSLALRLRQLEDAIQSGREEAIKPVVEQVRRIEGEGGVYWRLGEANRLIIVARRDKAFAGLKDARVLLNDALGRRPDLLDAHRLLGELEELENKPDQAIASYQKAISGGSRQSSAVGRLATLLLGRGRFVEANKVIQLLEVQAALSPDFKKVAAEVAVRSNDLTRALILVKSAIPADSKSAADSLWLAKMLIDLKQPTEAEAAARRAVELEPTSPPVRIALVETLVALGQKERATVAAAEAEKAIGPDAKVDLAILAWTIGRLDVAKRRFDEALIARPDDVRTLRDASRFFVTVGQSGRSVPLLRKLIEPSVKASELDVFLARRSLALALSTSRRPKTLEEAEALLDDNLKLRPDSVEDLRLKAKIVTNEPARRKDAIRLYEQIRSRQPLTTEESFMLARLLDLDGQWASARQIVLPMLSAGDKPPLGVVSWYASKLLKRKETNEAGVWIAKFEAADAKSLDAAFLRARWLVAMNHGAEAAALLEPRAQESPDVAPAIALVLEEIGQVDAAQRVLRGIIDAGRRVDASLLMAQFLARRGRITEALDLCDAAWATCEPQQVAATTLAVLETPAGQADAAATTRAMKSLEAALAKTPKITVLYTTLAMLRLRQGQTKEAEDLYRRVIAMYPSDTTLLNNFAWMLCYVEGRGAEALATIEKAIAVEGPESHFLDTRGLANLVAGKVEPAITDFERSIAGGPNDTSTVYFHLARAQLAAKKPAAANESLRKGEALGLKTEVLHPIEQPSYRALRAALGMK